MLFFLGMGTSSCWASTTYNAATAFEGGWTTHSNPNGVWSYGYSPGGFAGPVTLFDSTQQPGLNGPNTQFWFASSFNVLVPSAEYNDGPAYNNGNVDFLKDEFLLVASYPFAALVFAAPVNGTYTIAAKFRGAQVGIGVIVGVVANNRLLFNSSVTSLNQIVPFNGKVTLNAGQTIVFTAGPGGGTQNTGLSAIVTGP